MDRIKLINTCISRFGYKKYLEIGCASNHCFDNVNIEYKVGVDPDMGGTLRMTSDEFFRDNAENFDIVFIDGLHLSDQVVKDILNSIEILNENGTIVLHDCKPRDEATQMVPAVTPEWNGDVWKAIVNFRTCSNLDVAVGDFDWGCGVIRVRQNSCQITIDKPYWELTWSDYENDYKRLLRLLDKDELLGWL